MWVYFIATLITQHHDDDTTEQPCQSSCKRVPQQREQRVGKLAWASQRCPPICTLSVAGHPRCDHHSYKTTNHARETFTIVLPVFMSHLPPFHHLLICLEEAADL